MLILNARPYRLIVADRKKTAEASQGPVCMGSDHARETLDQIVEQISQQRKKMKLEQEFAVLLWRVPTE